MDWIDTPESSNITRFAYNGDTQILTVEFHNGSVYEYFGVPDHIFSGMRAAPSKGQYLAQQIKGIYRYARV